MANPSISIDDEVIEEFDKIREAKEDMIGESATIARSAVIQQLMKEWIEDNRDVLDEADEGKRNPATAEVLAD